MYKDTFSLNIGKLNFAKEHRGKKPTFHLTWQEDTAEQKYPRYLISLGESHPSWQQWKWIDKNLPSENLTGTTKYQTNYDHCGNHTFRWWRISETSNSNVQPFLIMQLTLIYKLWILVNKPINGMFAYICQISEEIWIFFVSAGFIQELYQEACDYQELNREEVVRRSFKNLHKEAFNFTDSQISLFWITNDQKPLKQWVRNRVIEIQRFTKIN